MAVVGHRGPGPARQRHAVRSESSCCGEAGLAAWWATGGRAARRATPRAHAAVAEKRSLQAARADHRAARARRLERVRVMAVAEDDTDAACGRAARARAIDARCARVVRRDGAVASTPRSRARAARSRARRRRARERDRRRAAVVDRARAHLRAERGHRLGAHACARARPRRRRPPRPRASPRPTARPASDGAPRLGAPSDDGAPRPRPSPKPSGLVGGPPRCAPPDAARLPAVVRRSRPASADGRPERSRRARSAARPRPPRRSAARPRARPSRGRAPPPRPKRLARRRDQPAVELEQVIAEGLRARARYGGRRGRLLSSSARGRNPVDV